MHLALYAALEAPLFHDLEGEIEPLFLGWRYVLLRHGGTFAKEKLV